MTSQDIISLYSNSQLGGELPYFIGRQYGSGWLKTLGRVALPFLKRIGGVAAKTFKDVVVDKKSILPSLASNAAIAINDMVTPKNNVKRKHNQQPQKRSINKIRKTDGTIFEK
jgi:hypothetical protein